MQNLTEGKETRKIVYFATPMLLGNIFQQLYNVVDSFIVGNYLGKEALSAVGAAFPVMFTLISVIIGFASGTTVIIAQYFGAGELTRVKEAVDTLFVVLLFGGIILGGIGVLFTDEILMLIDLPSHVIPRATDYLTVIFSGFVLTFGFNGTSAVLRGMGDSKTPLYFLIISTLVNIFLDYFLVVFLDMGVKGVAIATVLSQAGAFIIAMIYLSRNHRIVDFRARNFRFSKAMLRKNVKIGTPTGAQHLFLSLGMVTLFRIVNSFGTNVIAAYTVGGRLNSFAMMPIMNFSTALSTFVGQNIGAGKMHRVYRGLRSTLFLTIGIGLFFTLIASVFAHPLMEVFTKDEGVIRVGVDYLRIVCSFYFIYAFLSCFNAIFRGAGDTMIPMFTTLFSLWLIRIPVAYILSDYLGFNGIWWSVPFGWIAGAVFAIIYYLSKRWKRKIIIGDLSQ